MHSSPPLYERCPFGAPPSKTQLSDLNIYGILSTSQRGMYRPSEVSLVTGAARASV
jgi:hypothetical protein